MENLAHRVSQFLHGEQGALLCTARIVETVPWIDAKYYASTQVMDEARHVEVFGRYLDEKMATRYPMNAHLGALIDDVLADSRWDITYLGMQIMIEGLALAAFGAMYQTTTEPLLRQLIRYVMSDEARHVAFGVLSLQEAYAEHLGRRAARAAGVRVRSRAAHARPLPAPGGVGAARRVGPGDGAVLHPPEQRGGDPLPADAVRQDRAELQEARLARRPRRLVARPLHRDGRDRVRGLRRHERRVQRAQRDRTRPQRPSGSEARRCARSSSPARRAGIGAPLAGRCAARGAQVALVARSEGPLAKLAADLGGDAYPADLSDADVDRAAGRTHRGRRPDRRARQQRRASTSPARSPSCRPTSIEQLIAVNLLAPILLCRDVIPGMLTRGRGHIVNVSSLAGTNALPGVVPYSTSKAGLSHFTAGLRAELKGTCVTTTLAEIGPVESSMMDSLREPRPTERALARLARLRARRRPRHGRRRRRARRRDRARTPSRADAEARRVVPVADRITPSHDRMAAGRSDDDHPRVADDLTPEWLSDALGRDITGVQLEPVGVGVGLVGTLFRLPLEGDGEPATMIAKLSAPTDEGRFVATVLNMYGREVGFYTRAVGAHGDRASRVLLRGARSRDAGLGAACSKTSPRAARCRPARRRRRRATRRPRCARSPRHHATFWDDDYARPTHPFLLRLADDPYPGAVAFAYDTAWPTCRSSSPTSITPEVKRVRRRVLRRASPRCSPRCATGRMVLSHADWRLDNLFLTPDGEVIAVDWQLIDRSVGPRDLSYFVTQSVNVSDPAGYQKLFDMYLDELATHGVDVDRDWAWEMYRYGAVRVRVPGRRGGRADDRRSPATSS